MMIILLKAPKKLLRSLCIIFFCLILPLNLYASFIESTIGTAVVNDATASFYNPAALTLLKNPQAISLNSLANLNTHFNGEAQQIATGIIRSGGSNSHTNYLLPSLYFGLPWQHKITFGFAVIYDDFYRDIANDSLLRYVQSKNHIKNIDIVPAFGIKLNEMFAVGLGLNITHATFLLQPITEFPNINPSESESRNETASTSLGGHVGFLLKPTTSTLIGFNYRSLVTYHMSGKSTLYANQITTSKNYHFTFWTPASSTLSVNQSITKTLGIIGTIQRIEWSVFQHVNNQNIATRLGIISVSVPYHFHNTWLLTLGGHFRIQPNWVVRLAATYNQSPASGYYQITNGDSITLGGSMGYDINKYVTLDGSYSHSFIKNQNIHINTNRYLINGLNEGFRNGYSLKITLNV